MGQGFPDKIARGVPYFGFYGIFINKSFQIFLGGPMFTHPSPLAPCVGLKNPLGRVKRIMPTGDFVNMATLNRNVSNKNRQLYSAFDFATF